MPILPSPKPGQGRPCGMRGPEEVGFIGSLAPIYPGDQGAPFATIDKMLANRHAGIDADEGRDER